MNINDIKESIREDYLQIIDSLQDKYLSFKLGDEQIEALLQIFEFVHQPDWADFVLSGAGGSGKTSITKLLVHYLDSINIPYLLATPTNKACNVISQVTERESITLHKLLSLKPSLDILKLDYKDLQWDADTLSSGIPYNGLLIVDECSMINEALYDFIVERAKNNNSKILFLGDIKQIKPVKDRSLSKSFNAKYGFFLSKVHRQDDSNPVFKMITLLRERPLYQFVNLRSNTGNLFTYNSWKPFIKDNIALFKEAVNNQDPTRIKLLAYTNKRVEAFNQVIRGGIFSDSREYHLGEILMGYDTCTYKEGTSRNCFGTDVINSSEYIVLGYDICDKSIGFGTFKGYKLTLKSLNEDDEPGDVFILSRENSEQDLANLAAYIELLRLDAVQCKNKQKAGRLWKTYFQVMESFLTPVDLIYEGRVVRKKSLDYGYCISCHRAQGSTYDDVLIDMGNLFICKNREELRQLQYVAMSRTRNNVSILI